MTSASARADVLLNGAVCRGTFLAPALPVHPFMAPDRAKELPAPLATTT
jgi:hypothetical protein